jgi:hypothetical protein
MGMNNKRRENYIEEIEKFITTTDDWCPNYEGDKVRIFLANYKYDKPIYSFVRIAVWGNDDFGLEMDFKDTSEENRLKYIEWKENIFDKVPEPCTMKYFKELGFYNA